MDLASHFMLEHKININIRTAKTVDKVLRSEFNYFIKRWRMAGCTFDSKADTLSSFFRARWTF